MAKIFAQRGCIGEFDGVDNWAVPMQPAFIHPVKIMAKKE